MLNFPNLHSSIFFKTQSHTHRQKFSLRQRQKLTISGIHPPLQQKQQIGNPHSEEKEGANTNSEEDPESEEEEEEELSKNNEGNPGSEEEHNKNIEGKDKSDEEEVRLMQDCRIQVKKG